MPIFTFIIFAILLLMPSLISFPALAKVGSYTENDGNVVDLPSKCNKCVVFRLDDIQDHYYGKEQIQIMELFRQHGKGLTIGIIGNAFGNDTKLVSYIKEHLGNNLEIANHGWQHEDFSLLSKVHQGALMAMTNAKLEKMLGIAPSTFVTPFNTLNNSTVEAMRENNLDIISADNYSDTFHIDYAKFDPHDPDHRASIKIYHFPMNAYMSTYDQEQARWIQASEVQILASIDKGISKNGFSVVMMHPWDDIKKIESVLSSLESNGYNIVTMKGLRSALIGDKGVTIICEGVVGTHSLYFWCRVVEK